MFQKNPQSKRRGDGRGRGLSANVSRGMESLALTRLNRKIRKELAGCQADEDAACGTEPGTADLAAQAVWHEV